MALYIGLMSGTSLDGVDGVLAELSSTPSAAGPMRVLAHHHQAFAPALREQLLRLNTRGDDELHRAALATNALVRDYADVVARLREVATAPVIAVGAHGQTVRHRPGAFDGTGYTLQLMNGALLAELAGIDVVCDFRSRDVAAGGQGAPLVPALHAALFATPGEDVAVLNLGGIANLSLLPANGPVQGFDCGPANALLDGWCQRHLARDFDDDGRWAASGAVDQPLLQRLLAEPYLALPPPKSTGRDLFDMAWLDGHLAQHGRRHRPRGRASHAGRVQRPRRGRCAAPTCPSAPAGCWCAAAVRSTSTRCADLPRCCRKRPCRPQRHTACRRNRSRPWPLPGWPGPSLRGKAATCRR